jgi:hypothetical protein
MKRVHTAAAIAACSVVLGIVASPVSAGVPAPTGTITVEPTSGLPGFEFTFSGEGCVSENGPGVVELFVFFGGELIFNPDPAFVEPDEDGNWGVGMVPNGFIPNAEAVGTWEVTATCFDVVTDQVLVDYEAATFEVTAPPTPPTTVTVTAFDCESVTVTGSGWEETEATIEVAVPPSEGGETREDLVAGPTQVFPNAEGNIPPTVLPFKITPPDGSYAAVVLVDNIVAEQSPGFTLTGCGAAPPARPAAPVAGEPDFTG